MYRKRKLNWIILADALNEPPHFGGPLILHYISKILLELGDRVLMNHPYYEGAELLNYEVLKNLNLNEWILIKTENDFRLSDFGFNKVVRLLLYTPKNDSIYDKDELIVQYGKSFTINTTYYDCLSIKPIVINLDFWKNLQCERSNKPLILMKKGKIKKETDLVEGIKLDSIIHSKNTRQALDFELLKYFNTHKTFITYDNETFYSVQAALCGAVSIVIPDGRLTEDEWRNSNPIRKWGIAYGNTEEQIEFAIKTNIKLHETLVNKVENSKKEIEIFKKTVSERFF